MIGKVRKYQQHELLIWLVGILRYCPFSLFPRHTD
jgi:hypothetical protein